MYTVKALNNYSFEPFALCPMTGGQAMFSLVEWEGLAVTKAVPLSPFGSLDFTVVPAQGLENLPAAQIYLAEPGSQWTIEVFTAGGDLVRRYLIKVS